MILEIEVGIIAAVALVLLGAFVWVLVQLKSVVEESVEVLKKVNTELPMIFKETASTVHTLNQIAEDVREGAQKAKILGDALGAIGETVNEVHDGVRRKAASLIWNASGVMAGVRAAVGVLVRGGRGR